MSPELIMRVVKTSVFVAPALWLTYNLLPWFLLMYGVPPLRPVAYLLGLLILVVVWVLSEEAVRVWRGY